MSREYLLSSSLAVLIAVALLAPGRVAGQTQPATKSAQPAAKKWKPPRTVDGQPDFQGFYATATLTPLERAPEFANKEFLTEQEAAAFVKQTLDRVNTDRRDGGAQVDLSRNYNEFWRDRATSVVPSRRTSLVVDPPDGKVPPLTPEARRKRAARAQAERSRSGPEDLALRIRCITRGLPMLPTPNNNFLQIVQNKDYVVILQEMMYEARLIPLSNAPHAPSYVQGYLGDSRGHWEGDTLVIDTTNFSPNHEFMGSHENLHLVERLTRTDPDTILYQFTVDDPTTFTRPWSAELPMRRTTEGVFPYECHEGNYSLVTILEGARAEERAAEEAAKKK
jgi:hypothetical protein